MDNFDDYAIQIDSECLHQDFDDVDLYGNKIMEEPDDNFGNNIEFE